MKRITSVIIQQVKRDTKGIKIGHVISNIFVYENSESHEQTQYAS